MTQLHVENDIEIHLYLASRSPRRLALLEQIGLRVALVDVETDETRLAGESPEDYVVRVAREKAWAGRGALIAGETRPVLAADTAVVVDGMTLGKPSDRDLALRMLRLLSGRTHRVLTAVALIAGEREFTATSESRVTFRPLDELEILLYWQTGEPCDKAGGYAIQGLGALFIADLQGSYSGVMGLPLFETGQLLADAGIAVVAAASARR